jgi:hypothetical protein
MRRVIVGLLPLLAMGACTASGAGPGAADTPEDGGSNTEEGGVDAGSGTDAGTDARAGHADGAVEGAVSSDASDGATGSGAHVKWHPGHYGLTWGQPRAYGDPVDTGEMDTLSGKSAIVGYKAWIYWSALDLGSVSFASSVGGSTSGTLTAASTQGDGGAGMALTDGTYWLAFSDGSYRKVTLAGNDVSWTGALGAGSITGAYVYQFAQIDAYLSYLETKLDVPRHFVLSVAPGVFNGTTLDDSVLPNYILTDPAMGPSPVSGSYGWWGGTGNGNTATAALHRTALNDRWTALVKAIGAFYDGEPYFEGFAQQEDSWEEGALSTNGCPDYSNSAYLANMRTFLSAAVAAFPHTNVIEQNSWVGVATDAQELEDWMTKHRVAPGEADTVGASAIQAGGIAGALPWGVAAYLGVVANGSSWSPPYDMRPMIRYMPDVEAPDMGAFGGLGGQSFSPSDLLSALNDTLQASHVFWDMIPDGATDILPPNDNGQAWWSNLCAFLAAHPLTHTTYPQVYP